MMDISSLLASGLDFSDPGVAIPVIAITGGLFTGIVMMIACSIKDCVVSNHAEQTRREIAAYIAEGSISVEEGERLMKGARGD